MPRGGRRPGAGRPRRAQEEYWHRRRTLLQQTVSDADWIEIVQRAIEQARAGDRYAREWLASYVAGPPPKEVTLRGDGEMPLTIREIVVEMQPEEAEGSQDGA
jgi:hypothetical protein